MEDVRNEIQFIPCNESYSGGSLKGSIMASFADLKEMFGEPAFEGKGDKITTEFVIDYEWYDNDEESEMGNFTLYDWRYGRDFNDDYKVIEWNIGGGCFNDGYVPSIALKLFEKTDIRYGRDDACLAHAQWHQLDGLDDTV